MITIPDTIWAGMLAEFAKERRRVEQVCYLDGALLGEDGIVTMMVFPDAELESGRFHVHPGSMHEAGKHLRLLRLRRLAQVHTHPCDWTGHSQWDNDWAYSQLPGAISIVLPHFGRRQLDLEQAGVHVRTPAGWQQLPQEQMLSWLRIVPAVLDFRRTHESQRVEPPRKRSWWSAFAFWKR